MLLRGLGISIGFLETGPGAAVAVEAAPCTERNTVGTLQSRSKS